MSPRPLALVFLAALSCGASLAETSPLASAPTAFLRAQATSPVHWQPWTEATLASAQASGRPLYVFVGHPLSELSRATFEQTFKREKTAAWLNEHFVCILVDADAQPDVAAYAQHFIHSVKQLRGWPVHLWLTPDLQPYDGANYLPPSEEWGKPGYLKAGRAALDAWTLHPARARALAAEALATMRPQPLGAAATIDLKTKLEKATAGWLAAVDPRHGGFGTAPKQPEPELIRFLLRRDPAARDAAVRAARALVSGAVRDPLDGGFYRYATDDAWKEPYRQKTLTDQARIALALLDAADAAGDPALRAAALGALDFALKELRNADGGFAAALDGTPGENADPASPPAFARIGTASTGAQGLLIAALQRTGEKRFTAIATQLADNLRARLAASDHALDHLPTLPTPATAADYAAVALAFRSLKDDATAGRLLLRANALFFDPTTDSYLATPAQLPAGIALRVPAFSGDTPSADALALLARVDAKTAASLRSALLSAIEYDDQPAGDVLLALAIEP